MPGPYRVLSTEDPNRTLGEAVEAGDVRYFPTLIEAANAFAKSEAPFKTVVFDDGHQARDLTATEERLLANVCAKLGLEVGEVGNRCRPSSASTPAARTRSLAAADATSTASRSSANAPVAADRRPRGFYKTRRWQLRRMQVFTRDPFCADGRMCEGKAPSVEVDHIIPLEQGGAPYAMDNLRGSCSDCHQAKTAEENRNRQRTGVGRERDAVA
jgi:5-methylcytosine-specific restriction endonuclease McrA